MAANFRQLATISQMFFKFQGLINGLLFFISYLRHKAGIAYTHFFRGE